MSIELLKNMATILGIVVSTLTLISAYNIYRLGKRDSYVKEIRNTLITFQYNCRSINQLLTYEIAHELVYDVVYSVQMNKILSKIYSKCFNENEEVLKQELDNFDPITTSIHAELLSQYNQTLKNNAQESSKIYTDFPSLYRVYETVISIFYHTIDVSKNVIRDEDLYKKILLEAYNEKDNILNVDDLKDYIFYTFMSGIQSGILKESQKNIDDILDILTMTTNSFMRLTDKGILKQKSNERKLNFKEMDKTETIFEDLLEAERGLGAVFSNEEMLQFRELSTRIKVRMEE